MANKPSKTAKNVQKKPKKAVSTVKQSVEKYPNRWKPGESGNPKGRPRTGVALSETIRAFLSEPWPADEKKTRMVALVEGLFNEGLGGKEAAARLLLSHGFGHPAQQINLEHTEVPLEEQQAQEFIESLEAHPRTQASYLKYLKAKRREELIDDRDRA